VAELDVLDVRHGLVEQVRHVVVVEVIDDPATLAVTDDEPEMAQDAQLMRDGGRLHRDGDRQLVDAERAGAKPPKDAHPTRCRERLHRVSYDRGDVLVELVGGP
jgi:hypothetical protein